MKVKKNYEEGHAMQFVNYQFAQVKSNIHLEKKRLSIFNPSGSTTKATVKSVNSNTNVYKLQVIKYEWHTTQKIM